MMDDNTVKKSGSKAKKTPTDQSVNNIGILFIVFSFVPAVIVWVTSTASLSEIVGFALPPIAVGGILVLAARRNMNITQVWNDQGQHVQKSAGFSDFFSLFRIKLSTVELTEQVNHYDTLGWLAARTQVVLISLLNLFWLVTVISNMDLLGITLFLILPIVLLIFVYRGNKWASVLMILQVLLYLYAKAFEPYEPEEILGSINSNLLFILQCIIIIAALLRTIQVELYKLNRNTLNSVGLIKTVKSIQFGTIRLIKKISFRWAWFGLIIIVFATSFWWFGVRPAQIKKDCSNRNRNSYNYEMCLHQSGL